VGPVTVAPGQVKAAVQGSRPRPYRSAVHLPVLADAQWDTLLNTVAARAGHLAALLDGEMPAELVDDARHAGVPLLPQPAEHTPELPDVPEPSAHTASLPVPPPPNSGLTGTDLERLMTDVAARATRLLSGDTTTLHLTRHQDAVRIAANRPGPEWFHHLIQ